MYNFCIKILLVAAVLITAMRADSSIGVTNELRVTAVTCWTGNGTIDVAGLQSAVSNGCPWLSLSMCDGLGDDSIWHGGYQWRLDYTPVALHRFDAAKNYQRFAGAHFWRPVCRSNAYELMIAQGPAFSPGDASGYMVVSNLSDTVASRVYPSRSYRDGAFLYSDLFAPHWLVWTTNGGVSYASGWPFVNIPIGTNETYRFERVPIHWEICTKALALRTEADFALVSGERGVMPSFYIALTETTEGTVTEAISHGVAAGLCASGDFAVSSGRGAGYPETGRTMAAALALCNLATRLHNDTTGDALTYVYSVTNVVFFTVPSNVMDVVRNDQATGYRLPTRDEYALAISGDNRNRYPWGNTVSYEWFYATNGLPVTETVLTSMEEMREFYLKYELATTNSTANFTSRNGVRHVSPGRVSPVRAQYREWSQPALNTNGLPVTWLICGFSGPMYFGDSTSDGAWGEGVRQVHDLSGNVSEMAWPPVRRDWGSVRVCLMGGAPALDADFARAERQAWCSAAGGRDTVGFRFARNKLEVAR